MTNENYFKHHKCLRVGDYVETTDEYSKLMTIQCAFTGRITAASHGVIYTVLDEQGEHHHINEYWLKKICPRVKKGNKRIILTDLLSGSSYTDLQRVVETLDTPHLIRLAQVIHGRLYKRLR